MVKKKEFHTLEVLNVGGYKERSERLGRPSTIPGLHMVDMHAKYVQDERTR